MTMNRKSNLVSTTELSAISYWLLAIGSNRYNENNLF